MPPTSLRMCLPDPHSCLKARSAVPRCVALALGCVSIGSCGADAPDPAAWNDGDGHRWAELVVPRGEAVGFERMDPSVLGLDFQNHLSEEAIVANRNLLNGSGVALGDVTGDGRPDLYLARLEGPNRLYENLGGWRFLDITDSAGVALPDQFSTGTTFADVDGDADLDLLVSANGADTRLFLNDGGGRFAEAAGALSTGDTPGSTSMALADVDLDGDLDLYVANYKEHSVRDLWPYEQEFRFIVERVDGEYRVREKYRDHYRLELRDSVLVWFEEGEQDRLFLNDGSGRFESIGLDGVLFDADGTPIDEPLRDWGLHARFHDITADGWPDLYVANDFESPDRIWVNRGDGTFQAAPPLAARKGSLSSMAVDFSDVDRDGLTDFFVVEMLSRDHEKRLRQMGTMAPSPQPVGAIDNQPQYMGNTLFMNRGDGTFAEVAEQAGVRRSDWSWATLFLDVDLDGFEDILVSTGHHYDVQDSDANQLIRNRTAMGRLDLERSMLLFPPLEVTNALFRNRGDGSFEEVSGDWGFAEPDVSHGMALADLDGDGDLDLVVNRLGYDVAVYRNLASAARVQVRLRGQAPNTAGVGAVVRLLGGPVTQAKELGAGGTYLSGSDPSWTFATGDAPGPFTLEVEWPGGGTSVVDDVRTNRIYEVTEPPRGAMAASPPVGSSVVASPSGESSVAASPPVGSSVAAPDADALFEDASPGHSHLENSYADFGRQALLPYRLGRWGPGLAWFDPDGDGLDDLFIGNGAGAGITWLRNRDGRLAEVDGTALSAPGTRDAAAIVGWRENGVARLLVSRSNHEAEPGAGSEGVEIWEFVDGTPRRRPGIPDWGSSPGALALGDVDGDGLLDLFAGGRVVRNRYPEPASSKLFRNVGDGRFVEMEGMDLLDRVGLVTSAVFADLDQDGRPELVLGREWGTLMVVSFADDGDSGVSASDVSAAWDVPAAPGFWNGVTTGDLNGDGRLEVVATNWGRNHLYAATSDPDRPTRIRYGDLDGDGDVEVIETYVVGAAGVEVPRRSFSVLWTELPFIQERIKTYEAFARASVDEIFGGRLLETSEVAASSFEHVVLWNRGGRFETEALPDVAQRSPAFHVTVSDLTGDGMEDVFMSQNFFSYQLETPRSDAGRGLLLRGDGQGGLTAVPGRESGIEVYGEQRGGGAADADGDGRVDLVVGQNGAPTRLLRNRGASPGLRVRLDGGRANPQGVGAQIRLVVDGSAGPVREIRAGSGYWSMDSVVPVFHLQRPAAELRVRWPGGEELEYGVPDGAREVVLGRNGSVRVTREAPR